jgi:hypothetical protein
LRNREARLGAERQRLYLLTEAVRVDAKRADPQAIWRETGR